MLVLRLGRQQGRFNGVEVLLADEGERQHGPRQAPLVEALLEQSDLEQRLQELRQEVGALVDVLCEHLHTHTPPLVTITAGGGKVG